MYLRVVSPAQTLGSRLAPLGQDAKRADTRGKFSKTWVNNSPDKQYNSGYSLVLLIFPGDLLTSCSVHEGTGFPLFIFETCRDCSFLRKRKFIKIRELIQTKFESAKMKHFRREIETCISRTDAPDEDTHVPWACASHKRARPTNMYVPWTNV